jgi:hypothetical protein
MLRQKAKEIALKLNAAFTFLKGWLDQFRKYAWSSCQTMSRESESVNEEDVDA